MCVFLLLSPILMAYKLSQFFVMDLWLLILLSSCILTSLQVTSEDLKLYLIKPVCHVYALNYCKDCVG